MRQNFFLKSLGFRSLVWMCKQTNERESLIRSQRDHFISAEIF